MPERLPKILRTRVADERRRDGEQVEPIPARLDERYDPSPDPVQRSIS